mmetsp:Transcript_2121/g.7170  ORF Transcript_2121/g.7170 Transcript_2121/m.7170 type:complete len:309 (+) Transcript_2121:543-1469(+)
MDLASRRSESLQLPSRARAAAAFFSAFPATLKRKAGFAPTSLKSRRRSIEFGPSWTSPRVERMSRLSKKSLNSFSLKSPTHRNSCRASSGLSLKAAFASLSTRIPWASFSSQTIRFSSWLCVVTKSAETCESSSTTTTGFSPPTRSLKGRKTSTRSTLTSSERKNFVRITSAIRWTELESSTYTTFPQFRRACWTRDVLPPPRGPTTIMYCAGSGMSTNSRIAVSSPSRSTNVSLTFLASSGTSKRSRRARDTNSGFAIRSNHFRAASGVGRPGSGNGCTLRRTVDLEGDCHRETAGEHRFFWNGVWT